MSLYYDAEAILVDKTLSGSLKSRIYGTKSTRSKPAQLFALVSETVKYNEFLKEVVDNSGILAHEPKLNPILSLLLLHDHFFSKGGISAATGHPIRQAVERHKARLQAEFTKAKLRRRCATIDQLKAELSVGKNTNENLRIRWARINALKCDNTDQYHELLPGFHQLSFSKKSELHAGNRKFFVDQHVPEVLGFGSNEEINTLPVYEHGTLILQDKASCFPAYLLLGDQEYQDVGDIVDGCAAPGNKTTHLAAIMHQKGMTGTIYACERDLARSKTLQMMTKKAGADIRVQVLVKQDFLALKPSDPRFNRVTHLLLDPSCSGSGILGRTDIPELVLPRAHDASKPRIDFVDGSPVSKKRKRGGKETHSKAEVSLAPSEGNDEQESTVVDHERLTKLSNLQTRIVEHAMAFPEARRITYSTCSIHSEENEQVVSRVLSSAVAVQRGWRILRRDEHVVGMKKWTHRGEMQRVNKQSGEYVLSQEELDACVRCYPGDGEGTMGFFVCGFVRDQQLRRMSKDLNIHPVQDNESQKEEEEWSGFGDD